MLSLPKHNEGKTKVFRTVGLEWLFDRLSDSIPHQTTNIMSDQNQNNPNQPNQINIELPEETAEGTYSNLTIVTHSPSEFILDFIQLMPGVPKGKVKSRIVMTPDNAKKLMKAMTENIQKYESTHGTIKEVGPQGTPIPMNFGGPNTEA